MAKKGQANLLARTVVKGLNLKVKNLVNQIDHLNSV